MNYYEVFISDFNLLENWTYEQFLTLNIYIRSISIHFFQPDRRNSVVVFIEVTIYEEMKGVKPVSQFHSIHLFSLLEFIYINESI